MPHIPDGPVYPKLAICLYDLDRVDPTIRGALLGGKLDLSKPILTDPDRMDETAVAFRCDLLSAACIIDTIRAHDFLAGDHPTRCYLSRTGKTWTKLPGRVVLSRAVKGKISLSPDVFGVEDRSVELIALKPKPVKI